MQKVSLDALARQQIALAGSAGGGHTADTVFGGHEKVLRQTVIGMVAGARLAEHNNPGEATVLVLNGHVRLAAADLSWEGHRGDLLIVPDSRHSLEAVDRQRRPAHRGQETSLAAATRTGISANEQPQATWEWVSSFNLRALE